MEIEKTLEIRFMYMDHCSAIDAFFHKGKNEQIYNISGKSEKTNNEIIDMILIGFKLSVEDILGHDKRYGISSKKLKKS